MLNLNLEVENKGLGIVDVHMISIIAHDSEFASSNLWHRVREVSCGEVTAAKI